MKKIYIFILFYKFFPTIIYSQIGSTYWIDMGDINSIQLETSFDNITEKIGFPVQILNSKISGENYFYSYNYRVREYGYNFRRFLKPDIQNKTSWSNSEYILHFNFVNNILKSITRTDTESISSSYEYYDPASLDIGKMILGESKPIWIDIRDLSKVDIGMTEKEIIEQISTPSQLLIWDKSNSKETKKVFYRLREIFSAALTESKSKFKLNDEASNYIKLKKSDEKIFVKPQSVKKSGYSVYYTTVDGKTLGTAVNNIKEIIIDGKKTKIEENLKISGGIWAPQSYNVEFHYENGKLINIQKM